MKVSVPSAVHPADPAVLLRTWGSIGIVMFDSLNAIMIGGEAWLRTPTTVGVTPPQPAPPGPTPGPTPGPQPTPVGNVTYIDWDAEVIGGKWPPPGFTILPTH